MNTYDRPGLAEPRDLCVFFFVSGPRGIGLEKKIFFKKSKLSQTIQYSLHAGIQVCGKSNSKRKAMSESRNFKVNLFTEI